MISDEQLMTNAAEGDMDAFEQLVERHQQGALGVAFRFLSDRTAAEDVVQDAFLKILAGAGRYRPTAKFRTYLYSVIWHLCIDQYRRRKPRALETAPTPEDHAEGPLRSALRDERNSLLRQAVGELPRRQRMALVLKHFEGLSYAEIARALDCSTTAVDSLLIRAKRKLKERLAGLL